MTEYCFLNGKVMPLNEAKVGVNDIGLMRGYGIYDGSPVFNGQPFRFADHWQRFLSGAHTLNLNVPITEEKAEKIIKELVDKSGFNGRANAKMILTGGPSFNGVEYDFETPTFFILVEKWAPLSREFYEDGAKLVTYRHLRELPEFKTTNYIRAVNLQNWKKEEGAIEVLYVYDGELLEGASSNIFLIKGKTLITPAENILKGITRKTVLEIAKGRYEIEERLVREEELKTADEMFMTSSFRDIVPIVRVDDFKIGGGEVGPATKDFMGEFAKIINIG